MAELDARRIDGEMLNLFRGHLDRLFDPIDPDSVECFRPELDATLSGVLWWNCIWRERPTPGMSMMGLRYGDGRVASVGLSAGPRKSQRLLLGAFWVILPWVHERLRRAGLSRGWPFRPPESLEGRFWQVMERARAFFKCVYLFNLLAYLRGRRQYPTTSEWAAGIWLQPGLGSPTYRNVSVQFMNRQLLWDALTSFALFAAPLVDRTAVASRAAAATTATSALLSDVSSGVSGRMGLPQWPKDWRNHFAGSVNESGDTVHVLEGSERSHARDVKPGTKMHVVADVGDCAECKTARACTPFVSPCGHTFCYFCIYSSCASSKARDQDYCCPRCGVVMNPFTMQHWGAVGAEEESR
jgi:peroxin-2